MSSNMKLNWANLLSIKPSRPHGRKKSILSLKSKILSTFNMGAIILGSFGPSEANGAIYLPFGATMQKL
jgi:hypothetical protein